MIFHTSSMWIWVLIVHMNKLGCVGRVIVIGCINNTHTFQTTAGLEQCHQCHEIAMVPCTWSSFHKPSVQVCVFMWNRNKLDSLSIFFSSQLLIIEFHFQYDASAPESYQIYTNDTDMQSRWPWMFLSLHWSLGQGSIIRIASVHQFQG